MSRSRRKTPITGMTTARTAKPYKKQRVGQERAKARDLLIEGRKEREEHLFSLLSVELKPWDEWSCPRDGKQYFDKRKFPKLMRK